MQSITMQSFALNIRIMKILYLYPSEDVTLRFKLKAYFVFSVLIPPIPILGFLYFYFGNLTMDQLGENAFLIAQLGCQVPKFLPFIKNATQIVKCIHYFESSQFTMHRKEHKEIIDRCCWICRTISLVLLITIIAGIVFFAVRPIIMSTKPKLPVDIWLPFDPTSDVKIFTCVYVFIVCGVAYAAVACAAIDPLIGGLACLAIGQFKVLKDDLQYLNEYVEEIMQRGKTDIYEITKREILRQTIGQCVDRHNAILEFIQEYEDCFATSMLSQLAGSILVICFCCFQLSKLDPSSFNFISMFTFTCVELAQIYIYSFWGTMLFEESNSLTDAIYMGTWYECDLESRKELIILMERSKKPVVISAGAILDISIETFTTILRRSYSLLAVLKNF